MVFFAEFRASRGITLFEMQTAFPKSPRLIYDNILTWKVQLIKIVVSYQITGYSLKSLASPSYSPTAELSLNSEII
jgi:hypothetical protein